jgi:hypothetical protein
LRPHSWGRNGKNKEIENDRRNKHIKSAHGDRTVCT